MHNNDQLFYNLVPREFVMSYVSVGAVFMLNINLVLQTRKQKNKKGNEKHEKQANLYEFEYVHKYTAHTKRKVVQP